MAIEKRKIVFTATDEVDLITFENKKVKPAKNIVQQWYQIMHMGRLLDEKAPKYLLQAVGWSFHAPAAGHDGIQLALGLSFRKSKDFLYPYYRDLVTCLAAGLTPEEIILNGISKATDPASGGRHMSNHFGKPSIGIQLVSSAVGNHTLNAVGTARAIKYYNADSIAFASFGESAASEGFVFEAIAGAAREILPVIFVMQNNRLGISVPLEEQSVNEDVSDNFIGLKNLSIIKCDGTNVFDSWDKVQQSIKYVKSKKGPVLIHADCVRIGPHSNSDDHFLYRTIEELNEGLRYDPLSRFRKYIIEGKLLTNKSIETIEEKNTKTLNEAADKAEAASNPDPSTVFLHLRPDETYTGKYPEGVPHEILKDVDDHKTFNLREAINKTLFEEFRHNKNSFLWGQDVASKDKGGVFNVTKGMQQEFGRERVFNAPIAEDFIVGTANGFAHFRDDIWIVIEGAQFADYFWPAMEQLIELSHEYWRSNGQICLNIVIRLPSGNYIGGGIYHSQNLEGTFATLPGLRIVVPSFADDAAGLLRTAMRTRGITLYLEPKFLYNQIFAKSPVPPDDFSVPFGKARKRLEGNNYTIITYGTTTHFSLRAAEKLNQETGMIGDVIDIRSLVPLDTKMIFESVKKTGRVLIVHEDKVHGGFGGEIASQIMSELFDHLDAPVLRVGSKFSPVPFSPLLEKEVVPNSEWIYDKLKKLLSY